MIYKTIHANVIFIHL